MSSSPCKMVRTLIQLTRTLDKMPEERIVLMKLQYYDDVTPTDYESPFFRSCSEQEAKNQWTKNTLKMDVSGVNSKHLILALKEHSTRVKDFVHEDETEDEVEDECQLALLRN